MNKIEIGKIYKDSIVDNLFVVTNMVVDKKMKVWVVYYNCIFSNDKTLEGKRFVEKYMFFLVFNKELAQ